MNALLPWQRLRGTWCRRQSCPRESPCSRALAAVRCDHFNTALPGRVPVLQANDGQLHRTLSPSRHLCTIRCQVIPQRPSFRPDYRGFSTCASQNLRAMASGGSGGQRRSTSASSSPTRGGRGGACSGPSDSLQTSQRSLGTAPHLLGSHVCTCVMYQGKIFGTMYAAGRVKSSSDLLTGVMLPLQ